jgi:Zn-dependent protease
MDGLLPLLAKIAFWAPPVLAAVIFHELAHGYVAYRLGDPTAARLGRLTLNPLAHVDLFGTVLLPLMLIVSGSPFLFGYAKPVPVNFSNLRHPRRDMVYVAAAGPAMNLLLAVVSAFFLQQIQTSQFPGHLGATQPLQSSTSIILVSMLQVSVFINIALAVFNLFPIPPLDGGRVATGLLPRGLALPLARLEPYGMLIVIGLLMTGVLGDIVYPVTAFLVNVLL